MSDAAVFECIYLMMIPSILGSYVAPASAMGDSKTMSWWRMTYANMTAASAASEICLGLFLVGEYSCSSAS